MEERDPLPLSAPKVTRYATCTLSYRSSSAPSTMPKKIEDVLKRGGQVDLTRARIGGLTRVGGGDPHKRLCARSLPILDRLPLQWFSSSLSALLHASPPPFALFLTQPHRRPRHFVFFRGPYAVRYCLLQIFAPACNSHYPRLCRAKPVFSSLDLLPPAVDTVLYLRTNTISSRVKKFTYDDSLKVGLLPRRIRFSPDAKPSETSTLEEPSGPSVCRTGLA